MTILIIEDDEDVADALSLILEQLGHQVARVSSVAEARARVDEPWDTIIADRGLPGSEMGDAFLDWVRHKRPDLGRVLISGVRPAPGEESGHVFVLKPFGRQEIARALEAAAAFP